MPESKYTLSRDRFHLAEHYQQGYVAVVPQGTKPQDIEDPMFLSGVANQCRPSGRIFVECEDGTWVADVYIRFVGPQYVTCKLLNVWDLNEAAVAPVAVDSGYVIKWAGNHYKWRVIREADSAVVQANLQSEDAARFWLNEHLKAVAR